MYAKACATFVNGVGRISARRDRTDLRALADKSSVALQTSGAADSYRSHGTPQYLLGADDYCVDLVGNNDKSSPLQFGESSLVPTANASGAQGSPNQFHKVEIPAGAAPAPTFDGKDFAQSAEAEA